jgi:transcriptional activator SPT7
VVIKQEDKDPSRDLSSDSMIVEESKDPNDDSSKEDKKSDKKKGSKKQLAKGVNTAGMSSRELRNLMPETPPVKKWVCVCYSKLGLLIKKGGKDAILYEGQQELYDALDNVLTKLKAHSDHSYPFLTRVRKVDAPDYYNVIKHPMDLGTMTKKLQKCEYSSKAEFQADLTLIFNNCRTYNTDPVSLPTEANITCIEF